MFERLWTTTTMTDDGVWAVLMSNRSPYFEAIYEKNVKISMSHVYCIKVMNIWVYILEHVPCFLGMGDAKVRDFGRRMGDHIKAHDSNKFQRGQCKFIHYENLPMQYQHEKMRISSEKKMIY